MTTPWRKNNRVTFNKWLDCPRCGMPWPESSYVLQKGVKVCPECVDQPSAEDLRAQTTLRDVKPKIWTAETS